MDSAHSGGQVEQGREPRRNCRVLLFLFFLACSLPGLATAQTNSAIEGKIKDPQGALVPGATVNVAGESLPADRSVLTDESGYYRVVALPAGAYVVTVSQPGFADSRSHLTLPVNFTAMLDVELRLLANLVQIEVSDEAPLIDTTTSSSGGNVSALQVQELPVNGRNYQDLMQLVPGVTVNRQADQGSDSSTPVLGDRAGNTAFLIDGFSNQNEFGGGAAAQFNQDTISEFQVLTTGYKAEFGDASGGIVNVITKTGTNRYHALASLYHRNNVFDTSDIPHTNPPHLLRWDYDLAAGGPVVKDHVFVFGSLERIRESRRLNFVFPQSTPAILQSNEHRVDNPSQDFETRGFIKFDELFNRHHLTEEMNLTNEHTTEFLPLSETTSLPSTRRDLDSRHLLYGISDTILLGSLSNPWALSIHAQYRGEPVSERPAHPQVSPASTVFNIFSSLTTGMLFGDLGQVQFGSGLTPLTLHQKYTAFGSNANKLFGRHNVKLGWDFIRTNVDGQESNSVINQLFATLSDYQAFGPINSGFFIFGRIGGASSADNKIRLRNNYNGLFLQDDWKILEKLTLNLGARWDYDSRFAVARNVSPRLGFAWQPLPKTVIRGSFGYFYDHFRLGLARDVPGLGGANISFDEPVSYPRLFYGVPTLAPILLGLCLSPTLTDAQIQSSGATCPLGPLPYYGVDHLSNVVASGHAPIPSNIPVNLANIQSLSGLSPQAYADAASSAVGLPAGSFFWGPFGALSEPLVSQDFPIVVDPKFSTPYNRAYSLGIQREMGTEIVLAVDYYHKAILNILGLRDTNLAFEARIPGHEMELQPGTGNALIRGYGPWFKGSYDGLVISFRKRFARKFTLEANYTHARESDNALFADLTSGLAVGTLGGLPSDSFIGVPPVVTDPATGQTNANGPFVASNGNPVPQAGKFYNGPNLDRGHSNFSLTHTFLADGILELPWKAEISGIFRSQSGFPYSRGSSQAIDVDGDLNITSYDFSAGRNHFTSSNYINVDMRLSKIFAVGEHLKLQTLFEFFNLLNNANPAGVQTLPNADFGKPLQVLPGREGQIGLRIEF